VACGETVILVTKFAAHNLGADLQVLICLPVSLEVQALISLIYFFVYLLMCRLYFTSTGSRYRIVADDSDTYSCYQVDACMYFKANCRSRSDQD
jgi:hypothetical protein